MKPFAPDIHTRAWVLSSQPAPCQYCAWRPTIPKRFEKFEEKGLYEPCCRAPYKPNTYCLDLEPTGCDGRIEVPLCFMGIYRQLSDGEPSGEEMMLLSAGVLPSVQMPEVEE